jgi:alpha-tubulin suppressor-like RCC1 family protein
METKEGYEAPVSTPEEKEVMCVRRKTMTIILTLCMAVAISAPAFLLPTPATAGGGGGGIGTVAAWGRNSYGQLDVPAPNQDFTAVAGGGNHSLGLRSDGSIASWGLNNDGQLDVPAPNSGFIAVAAGNGHSLGLRSDGSIAAWGRNNYGQLTVPAPNSGFIAVAAGNVHSLGLRSDGSIAAWGNNSFGQLDVPAPNSGFIAVAGGAYHSLGLRSDGSIAAWGSNPYGQCTVPAPNSGFSAIAAGAAHSLGLRSDGSAAAWGSNSYGQCTLPASNTGFIAVAGGDYYSLGLRSDGSITAWGMNNDGQCDVPEPNSGFTAISGGGYHSLAIRAADNAKVWGYDGNGQLNVPAPNSGFKAIAAGNYHSLALHTDGSVTAWGASSFGQCDVPAPNSGFIAIGGGDYSSLGLKSDGSIVGWGNNSSGQLNLPAPNSGFVALSVGYRHCLGLKSDGSIAAWGDNSAGQLNVPAPNAGFKAVAAGGWFSLGLKSDGSIVGWGESGFGQLTPPAPNSGFTAVAASFRNGLGLRSDGSVAVWGENSQGMLNVPAPNSGFTTITANKQYSCSGLRSDGSIAAWGANGNGQLNVPAPNGRFSAIAMGWLDGYGIRAAYPVNASVSGGGGTVSPATQNTDYGSTATVDPTPDPGYGIASITDNGAPQAIVDPYPINNVDTAHTVVMTFARDDFNILASAQPGGSIDPSGTVVVDSGADQTFNITPDPGYYIKNVIVDGAAQEPVSTFTFNDVAAEHTIEASFAPWNYWYLAEGCTRDGFETWILVENPNPTPATISLEFDTEQGEVVEPKLQGLTIPANSRASYNLNSYMDTYYVATRVISDLPVVCERAMYGNDRKVGTESVGSTETSFAWYLAEGCTSAGYEDWILVENPNPSEVHIDFSLMTPEGLIRPSELQDLIMPAHTRYSWNLADYYVSSEISCMVASEGGPVVCERAMYGNERNWGTASIGAAQPGSSWYLAEGCTGEGFATWILVMNPTSKPQDYNVSFMSQTGGAVQGPQGQIAPYSRVTVNVADWIQAWDVSTLVTSSGGVVAERSMYGGDGAWATGSIGARDPAADWYFAEGSTDGGMETWILVENPNTGNAQVTITLDTAEGQVSPEGLKDVILMPMSRMSFRLNDYITTYDVSAHVDADKPVVCERAMYGPDKVWATASIGYAP